MQLQNSETLNRRIDTLLREQQVDSDVANRLCQENQADEANRAEKLWFCFYPPYIAGEQGIRRFFRCWGGEALYNSHENDPETGPILRAIGRPCLIEADVPIESLRLQGGLAFKVVRRFLISRGHNTNEPVDHEDRAENPLPSENIRRVMCFPEPDFIRMTECDTWKQPLM